MTTTTTDTDVQQLIINKLTEEQYKAIQNPSNTELYLTPDTVYGYEIDDIVWRLTPTNEGAKHLLDGTLLQYGSYKDYIDYKANEYGDTPTTFTIPTMTSNGTLGGSSFAVQASNNYDGTTYPLYLSFNGDDSNIWYCSSAPVDVIFYNPKPINITNIQCKNRTDASGYTFTSGTVYGSNDNSTYTQLGTFTNSDTAAGATYNIDLSSNAASYLYYKISFSSASTTGVGANFNITATYIDYPNSFCTEEQWQASVTTYGSCGKFVYDSVNKTVRLPKVSDILQGTTDVTALGDLVEAGLPNITADWKSGMTGSFWSSNGAVYAISDNSQEANSYSSGSRAYFDASRSSSLYKDGFNKVQPQTIKGLIYIIIATGISRTPVEININQILTDLNSKADVDLGNTIPAQSFKNSVIDWGMPDYTNITSTGNRAFNTVYNEGQGGIVFFNIGWDSSSGGATATIEVNGVTVLSPTNATYFTKIPTTFLIGAGDTYKVNVGGNSYAQLWFIPLKGAN